MYGDDLQRFNNVTPPTAKLGKFPSQSPNARQASPLSGRYSVEGKNAKETYHGFFSNMNIKSPGMRGLLAKREAN